MRLPKKAIIYGVVFLMLLAGFYYFVFSGNDQWKKQLPVISYVKPFQFMNQDGDSISQRNLEGRVYVANYFFTTCKGICPNMNGKLKTIYEEYKGDSSIAFLTHTCQPEVDSLPQLKAYAVSMGADGRQWQFLTGNKLELYNTARNSYRIDDPQNNVGSINDQFLHSQFLALVDKEGRVRGVYDGLRQKEINTLKKDIDLLLSDGRRSHFANNLFGNAPQ
jgi:protein SCO1/2